MINTTHGLLDESLLERTLGFEERPTEFVVWVEWRLKDHDGTGCAVCQDATLPRSQQGRTLVRRDAHCILKEPTVVATAMAAAI